ncbi:hypothetical protein WAI453_005315 [Rhynchosporium graminicola]
MHGGRMLRVDDEGRRLQHSLGAGNQTVRQTSSFRFPKQNTLEHCLSDERNVEDHRADDHPAVGKQLSLTSTAAP